MLSHANVLVTGAGGFIGSHLCERLLAERANVTAMIRYNGRSDIGSLRFLNADDKARLDIIAGDVQDADFMMQAIAGKDVVFHLAALIGIPYSYAAPRSYVRTNIEGTLNVLEASRRHGTAKVLHTSTSEVYGSARYTPMDEKHPLQGQSPYSASKIGADKIAESYARSFGLPVVTVRPFNTFGPRQSARAVIPTIISQALLTDAIHLGSLATQRDLTFVQDTVEGFIAAAKAGPEANGQEVNLGVGETITVGALAERILALMQVATPIVQDPVRLRPVDSEVDRLLSDNTKARELFGWRPRVHLDEGLRETIAFMRKNAGDFSPHTYAV